MPTPVGHALSGFAVYFALGRRSRSQDRALAAATVAAGLLPDLDFVFGLFAERSYHHHFTHSSGFAASFLLVSYALARALGRASPFRDASVLSAAYLSHIALDLLAKDTSPPFGVELFWPFSSEFYIAPVLVFSDVWRGSLALLLSLHNWMAAGLEMLILGPPAVLLWRWRRPRRPQDG